VARILEALDPRAPFALELHPALARLARPF
jgi:hypothetical protein